MDASWAGAWQYRWISTLMVIVNPGQASPTQAMAHYLCLHQIVLDAFEGLLSHTCLALHGIYKTLSTVYFIFSR
jgi:hypothetical protein